MRNIFGELCRRCSSSVRIATEEGNMWVHGRGQTWLRSECRTPSIASFRLFFRRYFYDGRVVQTDKEQVTTWHRWS